jgi:hypothetical protein
VSNAEAGDLLGGAAFQPASAKQDLAFAAHHAADRPQRGGFAGTVGAKQYRHAGFLHHDIDPVQDLGLSVKGLHRAQFEYRRHQCRVPR